MVYASGMPAVLCNIDTLIPRDADDKRKIYSARFSEAGAIFLAAQEPISVGEIVERLEGQIAPRRALEVLEHMVGDIFDLGAPAPLSPSALKGISDFHLRAIDESLENAIADAQARAKVQAFWENVPPEFRLGYNIVEIPLSGELRSIDIATNVLGGSLGYQSLRNQYGKLLSEEMRTDPAWRAVQMFVENWGEQCEIEFKEMPDLFLEFDLSQTLLGQARPSLWFRTACVSRDKSGLRAPASTAQDHDNLARRLFSTIGMTEVWNKGAERVLELFSPLPDNGRVHVDSIGALVAREDNREDLRIFFACFSPEEVVPYLERIGWDGNYQPLCARLDDPTQPLQINLQLTVRDGKLARELSMEFQPRSFGDSYSLGHVQWATQVDQILHELQRFVDKGWCSSERFEAIARWNGMAEYDGLLGQSQVRLISHFKLRTWDDGSCLDKLYLGVDLFPKIRAVSG